MGVDLRLLPLDGWHPASPGTQEKGWGYSHTVLNVSRDREAWKAFEALPQTPVGEADVTSHVGGNVPDGSAHGETMYGRLVEDAYGQPYQMCRAADLLPLLDRYWPGEPATEYVRALARDKPDNPIILDWH